MGSGQEGERGGEEVRLVVALVADLIFASRIRAAAPERGVEVRTASSAAKVEALVRASSPALLLVDLESRGGDPVALIARLKSDPVTSRVPIVAFAPHVHAERMAAARAAGAERVLARSAFVRGLAALMVEAVGAGGQAADAGGEAADAG